MRRAAQRSTKNDDGGRGRRALARRTLGEVETFFPDADLFRIHRHLLIRPAAVLGIRSSGNGNRILIRMMGGVELEASRGATPELKRRLRLG